MTALKSSGRRFVTAPMSMPPALAPWMTRYWLDVYFCAMRYSADAMKSVNVFILFIMRPASRQGSPNSPPPRMCAMAYTTPLSRSGSRLDENAGEIEAPYEMEEHTSELQSHLNL